MDTQKILSIIILVLLVFTLLIFLLQQRPIQQTIVPSQTQNVQELEEKIKSLQQEIDLLNKELEKNKPRILDYRVDLRYWSTDDIIRALAQKDSEFEDAEWFRYVYADSGAYYDQDGPFFPYDPFHNLAYKKSDRELTVNNLRIFDLDPSLTDYEDAAYATYRAKLDKEATINGTIVCTEEVGCRDVDLIICTAADQKFYSWYAYPYVFTTRNDNRETYELFQEFYCEEETKESLTTGSIIRALLNLE